MFARSSSEFGLELYGRLAAQPCDVAFSPFGIATAFTMAWAGARGATADQMKRVLHLDGSPPEVLPASGKLLANLQDQRHNVRLAIVNRLFAERSYPVERDYLDALATAYSSAPLEPVSFRAKPEMARIEINGWLEQQTEGRIRDLVLPGDIDRQTRIVLVNVLDFIGEWADPFPPDRTGDRTFYPRNRPAKNVTTMTQVGTFRIGRVADVRVLELCYKSRQMAMIFALTDSTDALPAFEKRLDLRELDALVASLRPLRAEIAVPRFELRPGSFSLAEELSRLGMTDAFDDVRADFTAMANRPDPEDRLFISKALHGAFVEVNEQETRAAAATVVHVLRLGSAPNEEIETFKINRPFLFFIRDGASGAVLFMGRIEDPSLCQRSA